MATYDPNSVATIMNDLSGGRINLNGSTISQNAALGGVTQAVYSTATKGFREEENDMYQTIHRAEKVMAVAALIAAPAGVNEVRAEKAWTSATSDAGWGDHIAALGFDGGASDLANAAEIYGKMEFECRDALTGSVIKAPEGGSIRMQGFSTLDDHQRNAIATGRGFAANVEILDSAGNVTGRQSVMATVTSSNVGDFRTSNIFAGTL